MADVSPGFFSAMIEALRRRFGGEGLDEEAAGAREGSELIAQELPPEVMPLDAVRRKRAQLAGIDAMLEDSR
jgi:hypothetical protein